MNFTECKFPDGRIGSKQTYAVFIDLFAFAKRMKPFRLFSFSVVEFYYRITSVNDGLIVEEIGLLSMIRVTPSILSYWLIDKFTNKIGQNSYIFFICPNSIGDG